MGADRLFGLANMWAMLGWLMLVLLPRNRWTSRLVHSGFWMAILSVVYVVLLLTIWGGVEGGFGSLEQVMMLFKSRWAVLLGWVHYLAFDLFVGSWLLRDGQKEGVHHLILVPLLLGTFLFGPTGYLVYLLVRTGKRKLAGREQEGEAV